MKPRKKIQLYFIAVILFLCFELSKQEDYLPYCNGIYIYRKYGSSNYYTSCAQISGSYIYEGYMSLYSGHSNCYFYYCYSSRPGTGCSTISERPGNVYKCGYPTDCTRNGYKYFIIKDNKCKDRCENCFIIKQPEYLLAFENLDEVLNYYHDSELFCDKAAKECWNFFPTLANFFIHSPLDSTKLHYELDECPNFYYEDIVRRNNPNNYNYFYTNGNKRCQPECRYFNKYYYDPDTHECFDSCEESPVKKFYYQKSVGDPKCYATLPPNTFRNYDSPIILDYCGQNGQNQSLYLYHKKDGDGKNICYPSCLNIPEGAYKYEIESYMCVNTTPSGSYKYFYKKFDGVIKYTTENECKKKNYIYLLGYECKTKCEDYYYKKEVDEPFIKCFSEPMECFDGVNNGKIFYNEKLRICWKDFQTGYYVQNKTVESSKELYEIVDECEHFYYAKEGYNYCTPSCKSVALYFINTNKKCQTDCKNIPKYYYDPDNNECLDSCKGREKNKFQLAYISNPPQECLEKCPNGKLYYDYDSNICLEHCGNDKISYKYHKDGEYICFSSCMEIQEGNYNYEKKDVNTDTYSCYKSPPSYCPYYYLKEDGTRVCQNATDCKSLNYIYLKGKECKESCDDHFKLEYKDGDVTFFKCLETPDDCYHEFSTSTDIYYNLRLKKCWASYPKDYFIKDSSEFSFHTIEVVEECEHYYLYNNIVRILLLFLLYEMKNVFYLL